MNPPTSSRCIQPTRHRPFSAHAFISVCRSTLLISAGITTMHPQSIVFDDTFADGERSTQSLPHSVAWHQNTATPGRLNVRPGRLELVTENFARGLWTYFPVVSLKVGEAVLCSFDFSFSGEVPAFGPSLRIGLCYTNGALPRRVDGGGGTLPAGPYQGYGIVSFSNNTTALLKRDGPAAQNPNASLISSVGENANAIWRTFGPGGRASPKASRTDTPYTVTLRIARTGPDSVVVTSSFTGGGLPGSSTLTIEDSANIFALFDTLAFNVVGESLGGSLFITRATVMTGVLPTFIQQPNAQAPTLGATATFTVAAASLQETAIVWQRKAAGSTAWANLSASGSYSGVTGTTLTISNVTGAMDRDEFRAVLTNPWGTMASDAAALTVASSRLVNLSVLTSLDSDGDEFTIGYVVGGSGTSGAKPILVRVAGPSLAAIGVEGPLLDPRLELFTGSAKSAENDNWGGTNLLNSAFNQVGAFAFSDSASRDAAALATLTSRDNSVRVLANGGGGGKVLAEVYDATPALGWTGGTPRLVNVSVLKHLGTGLTAGFVIGGNTSQKVLIRAIGPSLSAAPFHVEGVVADPKLVLFAGATPLMENDNWAGAPDLGAAFAAVSAFPLAPNSRDAAVMATLPPGTYTVEVSGAAGTTGAALVEEYELP